MVGKGIVSGKEICNSLNEIYSGEILLRQKYQIWYFIDVEKFDFPKNDFIRMVDKDMKASKINPNIIVAVVGNEDLIYGIARMWEIHMEVRESGFETMTFRKKEDAEVWISKKLNEI